MARMLRTTLALVLLFAAGCAAFPKIHRNAAERIRLEPAGRPARTFHYGVYLPRGYDAPENADRRWPLLVYLPGCWSHGDHLRFAGR